METSTNNSKLNPKDIVLSLIKDFPSRTQNILKKKFGLVDNQLQTLQAIGQTYNITRERVRQIVDDSIKILSQREPTRELTAIWDIYFNILKNNNYVMLESDLLEEIKNILKISSQSIKALRFLLFLNPNFVFQPETKDTRSYWYTKNRTQKDILNDVKLIENFLKQQNTSQNLESVWEWFKTSQQREVSKREVETYLNINKHLGRNIYGEYGLLGWSEINPSGAKDRAYLILKHQKKPMHFSEIAKQLNELRKITGASLASGDAWFKSVEIQTVHNELIKDPRFVLIGRGVYALRDWGYKEGKIIDVIKAVLANANHPLTKEEIVNEVQKYRLAKENTIFLNLHNKKYFKKLPDKHYTLVHPPKSKILEI